MVDAFIRLMKTGEETTGPMNIGNPHEVTILELAATIKELIGSTVDLKTLPLPENDPTRRCPDITMARKTLEWTPKVTLKDGLARTISYFDDLLLVVVQNGFGAALTYYQWKHALFIH